MDHICIDGKEEEITSSVSTKCFRGAAVISIVSFLNAVIPFSLINMQYLGRGVRENTW